MILAVAASAAFTLPLGGGRTATIDPLTWGVVLHKPEVVAAEPWNTYTKKPYERLKVQATSATWYDVHGEGDVTVTADKGRLHFHFDPTDTAFNAWPRLTVTGPLTLPVGGGMRVSGRDPSWRKRLTQIGDMQDVELPAEADLPAFAIAVPGGSLSYVMPEDGRTTLDFETAEGGGTRLRVGRRWTQRDLGQSKPFDVWIVPGPDVPLAPALAYRQILREQGGLARASAKPAAMRLAGAPQVQLKDAAAWEAFRALGLDRAWVGVDDALAGAATAAGYLAGPVESFRYVQDPADATMPTAVFDAELFENGARMNTAGNGEAGPGGKGWALSSEALAWAKRDWIGERAAAHLKAGAGGVLLRGEADGPIEEDADFRHRMTPWRDRENRLARMRKLADAGLALGAEGGAWWATPLLAFAQLPMGPVRPAEQVPLWAAVFHDALATATPAATPAERLRAMLYGMAPVRTLDAAGVRAQAAAIKAEHAFWGPVGRAIATVPLVAFEAVGADRMVQRTRFGDVVALTADFRRSTIEARWLATGRRQVLAVR